LLRLLEKGWLQDTISQAVDTTPAPRNGYEREHAPVETILERLGIDGIFRLRAVFGVGRRKCCIICQRG
jgi:hypothetical protein